MITAVVLVLDAKNAPKAQLILAIQILVRVALSAAWS